VRTVEAEPPLLSSSASADLAATHTLLSPKTSPLILFLRRDPLFSFSVALNLLLFAET
jgi:hypothetical protein